MRPSVLLAVTALFLVSFSMAMPIIGDGLYFSGLAARAGSSTPFVFQFVLSPFLNLYIQWQK